MNVSGNECSLKIGDKCPYFSLVGTDGKIYSSQDLVGSKCCLVYFTSNHCPICKAYEDRFLKLTKDYSNKQIKIFAICSNDPSNYPEDTIDEMQKKSSEWGDLFPYLQDPKQIAAKAFDARCTPELFIFDRNIQLSYHGTIDNNWRNTSGLRVEYARVAIDMILEGMVPEVRISNLEGCSIKWSDS